MPPAAEGLSATPGGIKPTGQWLGKAEAAPWRGFILALWGFLTPGVDSWPLRLPSSPLVPKCVSIPILCHMLAL